MSTLKVGTLQNASGVEVYTAKAWVNFNGTGTVAIRASGNVSSITDLGTGVYRLNFSSALLDANYAVVGTHLYDTSANNGQMLIGTDLQTSYCNVKAAYVTTTGGGTGSTDAPYVWAAIFR